MIWATMALLLIGAPATPTFAVDVGATSGTVGVSPAGAGTYSIPITVPAGTTGVQPKLALSYSSRGGNGVMGVGWSISGLTTISRCPTDLYYDDLLATGGAKIGIDGVDYDANDKFCLNGERLMAIKGVYGGEGTEYRTAFESFSKVISYGRTGSGPTRFRVWTKSGDIIDYGNTVDSRVIGQSRKGVRTWFVDKVSDRLGNYIQYKYALDVAAGTHRLARLQYTGNDAQGLAPYNRVDFVYRARTDVITAYHAGDKVLISKRLSNVKVSAEGQLARDYRIAYKAEATGRSRVISITECATATACFKPTSFSWSADGSATGTFTNVSLDKNSGITDSVWATQKVAATGDFNGDGLTDIYLMPSDAHGRSTGNIYDLVWLAKGDGTFTNVSLGKNSGITDSVWATQKVAATGDFNGDGLTDIYLMPSDAHGRSTGNIYDLVWLAKGDGTFTNVSLGKNSGITDSVWATQKVAATGDFNGDGLTDIYLMPSDIHGRSTGNIYDLVWLAKGDGTFTNVSLDRRSGITESVWATQKVSATGDFNGDGLTDIYLMPSDIHGRSTGNIYDLVWLAKGDGTFTNVSLDSRSGITDSVWATQKVSATGDFNGDGLTDIYLMPSDIHGRSTGNIYDLVWLAKGDGTFTNVSLDSRSGITNSVWATQKVSATGDFNGDGLTDIYLMPSDIHGRSTGNIYDLVWLAKGDGTFTNVSLDSRSGITNSVWATQKVSATGDFNGDGLTDIYLMPSDIYGRSTGNIYDLAWLAEGDGSPDTLTKITNGHGLSSEFRYKPLTDSTVYTKGTSAAQYTRNTIHAGLVVSEIKSDNGIGGSNSQFYTYAGLRTHRYGFGSLGFKSMTVTDGTTGIKDISSYSQNWQQHHQGLLTRKQTIASSGVVLGDKTVTWKTQFFRTGTTGVTCFRYVGHTVTNARDLNGVFASRVQEATTYDEYGFPTVLKVTTGNEDGTDSYSKITTNTYTHNAANWLLGRLTTAAVTHRQGNGKAQTTSTHRAVTENRPVTLTENFEGALSDWTNGAHRSGGATLTGFLASGAAFDGTGAQAVAKTFQLPGNAVGSATITFDFYEIDSYIMRGIKDYQQGSKYIFNETEFNAYANIFPNGKSKKKDFIVYVQDQEIARDSFVEDASMEYVLRIQGAPPQGDITLTHEDAFDDDGNRHSTSTRAPVQLGFGPAADEIHRFTITVPIVGNTIKLGFGTTNGASPFYTWGVDNLKISVTAAVPKTVSTTTVDHPIDITATTPDQTRRSAFTYTAAGQIATETIEPGNALSHTKTNTYNAFGAITTIAETWGPTGGDSIKAADGTTATTRTSSFTYDAKIRYRLTETNPLGHKQTSTFHAITGLPVTTTGPNGLTTTVAYDAFGRATLETRADGTTTSTTRTMCSAHCSYQVRIVTQGGATAEIHFDKLNREIFKRVWNVGAQKWITDATEYDAQGRVKRKSEPYFQPGAPAHWTVPTYDLLGRPIKSVAPDGAVTTTSYNGLSQVSTNALGQTKTVVKDAAGRTTTITDTAGNTITYVYDALGQVTSMASSAGTANSYTYDIRGNKISDTDPDKGTWAYTYNALGQVVEQTNARRQVTRMTYDLLGRMRTRIDDATAANPATRTATWIYDTQQKGIGKLTSAASPDYTATSTYDTLGRPSSSTEVIGTGLGKQTYTSSTTYDSFSRPATTAYPSGLTVRNVYDTDGALKQVTNATTNLVYWQRLGVDARGNITEFKLGNGAKTTRAHDAATGRLTRILTQSTAKTPSITYQDAHYRFDLLGNITQRRRGATLTEDFVYDTLNRVTTTTTTIGAAITTAGFTYDAKGNILTKTGVGSYTYGLVGASCAVGSVAGPHAVSAISGTKTAAYCYDANGNMTSGDGRTITYTAFDKPAAIHRGTTSVRFVYGPDRVRFKREDISSTGTTTTHYIAGRAFERIIAPGGAQTDKHYIGDFAVVTHAGVGETAVATTDYLHRDHLGSVEAISDEMGTLVEELSFDSWGRRRQGNWQPMTDAAIYAFDTTLTTRGYTGHEQLDPVGLVHMNGRVYDPTIGRFLSADPHVQAPGNLQNWNRYSYVMNNPLSYTDPTGFFFKKLFRSIGKAFGKVFKAIGSAFKKLLRNPLIRSIIQVVGCALTAAATAGLGCVAISAGLTLAAGGSIADALQAAAFSFASMGAFQVAGGIVNGIVSSVTAGAQLAADAVFAITTAVKAGVHGLVGGALAVAQGGNFLQGFIGSAAGAVGGQYAQGIFGSYGTGDFGDVVGRAAVSAVVGCAGASLSGGKCANGAVTAAFGSLFNGDRGKTFGAWFGGGVGAGIGGRIGGKEGAAAGAAYGAKFGGNFGSRVEDYLVKMPSTWGLFVSDQGEIFFLTSGGADPKYSWPAAGHVEGKAAIYMRENAIKYGAIFHNHPKGTCNICRTNIPNMLLSGSRLRVIPMAWDGTSRKHWYHKPFTYRGKGSP